MPDQMDTLLATQRARLAAEERERLIQRARGRISFMAGFHLVGGLLLLAIASVLVAFSPSLSGGSLWFAGLINAFVGYHRMTNERIAAILALLDEEKHGPKEAWIRRILTAERGR